MLAAETYRQRLETTGLSFIEFNYRVLQSYDYLHLFREHGCILQTGGSDQWGNITAGVDLIRRADGTVVGSRLIAQKFTKPEYFRARPSGVDYNAASTGGTNYGPSNPDHLAAVRERLDAVTQQEGVTAAQVPSEMVTASGAGMDPHIPPAAADLQVARVAAARGVTPDRVRALVAAHTEAPTFGFLGRARVNVLELNLALDVTFGAPTSKEAGSSDPAK